MQDRSERVRLFHLSSFGWSGDITGEKKEKKRGGGGVRLFNSSVHDAIQRETAKKTPDCDEEYLEISGPVEF